MASAFDPSTAFEVLSPPVQRLPLVFNSPHSGRSYPADFLAASRLDERTIRRSEDTFVDELFRPAVALGAPLLRAHFPRAWLDVNREPYELDPKMFDGPLPAYANVRSARVTGGLGTIPRLVAEGQEIYEGPVGVAEGLWRIERVYLPYHRALAGLLSATRARFGYAVLIDCHSMPSNVRGAALRGRPDFVLGDRHGTSCSTTIADAIDGILTRLGYDVSRNRPYPGGHITDHYGKPDQGFHAIQIEVNRALYLDERTLEKTGRWPSLAAGIEALVGEMAQQCRDWIEPVADAAE